MQKYASFVWDQYGNALKNASVTVKIAPGGANATIYSDDGVTPITNPLTTDSDGSYEFYAANGLYDMVITASGATFTAGNTTNLTLYDPLDGLATGTATLGSVFF